TDAASRTTSADAQRPPRTGTTSVTTGFPAVTVPVLSSTTVRTSPARCSAAPPLMRRPDCAARPVATITAVGTASPIAQGHAITNTAIAAAKARTPAVTPPSGASSATNQTTKVTI